MQYNIKTLRYFILFTWLISFDLYSQNISKGKSIFSGKCAICHGDEGKGIAGEGPSLNNIEYLSIASNKYIFFNIKNGREHTSMVFNKRKKKKITPYINDLVAYIRSWTTKFKNFKQIKINSSIKVSGNISKGKILFKNNCSSCHSLDASGYANGFNKKNIGLAIGFKGFLTITSDDFIKKTIQMGRSGKKGLVMPAFTNIFNSKKKNILQDKDINDIIVYLRSL